MVPNDNLIKTAKDFAGKRIVYPSGSSSASLMEAYFRVAGIPRDKINLIGVDSNSLATPMLLATWTAPSLRSRILSQ